MAFNTIQYVFKIFIQPELVDWDKEHVELKWTPPAEDGGAPIEEYVVEMRDKFSPQWKQVTVVPASATPNASVGGLHEGEEYEFRVVARNKAGKGQPSDPSDAVIAKDRNGELDELNWEHKKSHKIFLSKLKSFDILEFEFLECLIGNVFFRLINVFNLLTSGTENRSEFHSRDPGACRPTIPVGHPNCGRATARDHLGLRRPSAGLR